MKIEARSRQFRSRCARGWKVRPAAAFDGSDLAGVSDLADFIELTAHLLAPHGRFYAKGAAYRQELARLPHGFELERAVELTVPDLDAARHLLVIRRCGMSGCGCKA